MYCAEGIEGVEILALAVTIRLKIYILTTTLFEVLKQAFFFILERI